MTTPRTRDHRRTRAEDEVVSRFVGQLGIALSIDEFERTFREVVELTEISPDPADAASEFSAVERQALEQMGANFAPLAEDVPDPVEQTRVAYAALLLDTIPANDVAVHLDRDVSRVRQRTRERSLWSITTEAGTRYPRVQFADDGSEIRGMGAVLKALPPDLHPVAVLRWLTLPKPELRVEGETVSPRDWLRAGGQADEAVALAEDLHVV
jgi:hypothetical protein